MLALTPWENYSITAGVVKAMAQLNTPVKARYLILTSPVSRIAGAALIPIAAVADAFAHSVSAIIKLSTGVIISPYNTLAIVFFPDNAASVDFELSSGLVHVIQVVQSVFDGIVLSLICLLNPDRAYHYMQHRLLKAPEEIANQNDSLLKKKEEINELKERIQVEEQRLSALPVSETPSINGLPPPSRSIDMASPKKRVNKMASPRKQVNNHRSAHIQDLIQESKQPPPPPPPPPHSYSSLTVQARSEGVKNLPMPAKKAKKRAKLERNDEKIVKDSSLVTLVLEVLPKVNQTLNQIEPKLQDHKETDFFIFTKSCTIDSASDNEWEDSEEESSYQSLPKLENGSYPIELPLPPDVFAILQNAVKDRATFSYKELEDLASYYKAFKAEIENQVELKSKKPDVLSFIDNTILLSHGIHSSLWNSMVQSKDYMRI